MVLCDRLRGYYPNLMTERYRITEEEMSLLDAYDLFQRVGKNRGFLMSGGVVDERRTARTLLEEFRNLKIGRISLEHPNR